MKPGYKSKLPTHIYSGEWLIILRFPLTAPHQMSATLLLLLSESREVSLVPGGLAYPAQGESCICADLDRGGFCFSHRLLYRLHQILGIMHQHFCSLERESNEAGAITQDVTTAGISIEILKQSFTVLL